MALLEHILSAKRKLDDYWDSRNRVRSCEIALEQVRLLLYKECDRRGRKVLFDSSTIERVPAVKNDKPDFGDTGMVPCIVEVAEGYTYIYKGEAGDAGVLGEMIFGAVAMNCKSVSLKIHIMNDPKRLMCTKLFSVPRSPLISRGDRKMTEVKSNGALNSGTKPLSVPLLTEEGVSLSFSMDRGDSGFCGEQSPYSSVGSTCDYFSMFDTWEHNSADDYCFYTPSKLSCSSGSSWRRRTYHSMATRFEFTANSLQVPTSATMSSSDSQLYSNSSTSGTTGSLASSSITTRRGKLGLALLISVTESADMDLIRRCMEHSPQLQALVCRLRLAALAAGVGNAFVSTLHRATEDAARWLSDLMFGPRLHSAWLDLVTSEPDNTNKIASTLLSDLCFVLSIGDTKNTNFFISTLLTYVLTHHLGWVTTVSPYDTVEDPQSKQDLTDSRRPYNALWAQLTDLCGNVGFPPRSARTIITGTKNVNFINKLLAVLTYFVRCGDVKKNDFKYQDCVLSDAKIVKVNKHNSDTGRTAKRLEVKECFIDNNLRVPTFKRSSGSSGSTLVASEGGLKKSTTLADLSHKLSSSEFAVDSTSCGQPKPLRRQPTMMISLKDSSDSSSNLSTSEESDKVLFVLGDDEKLVGLKNKSNGGKCVKKSSKVHNEPVNLETEEAEVTTTEVDVKEKSSRSTDSPSKCCAQTLQHSKPIKHSGFKFEFDKYPQIVTNYMKSKNLEILDRHYIGKPGNLKLDNFQFDPTFVPPIQEERCETCYKCQLMESMLQTPTNASEMEYMNDMPRQTEPQFARESIVKEPEQREMSPKTFVRKQKENTVIVNVNKNASLLKEVCTLNVNGTEERGNRNDNLEVKQVIEMPLPRMHTHLRTQARSGYDVTLLGGVTNHYVPDLVLQGTLANPSVWEAELRRDLDLASYLHKSTDAPVQAVAIVGDTNSWEVRLIGRGCGSGGLSPLVGGMLDTLTAMRMAQIPPQQCLLYLESKLREFCVLSKTLADMLMSTDFCDIATLTRSLNIDVNDVPLLLAIATTHTPQVTRRYGISYR